MFPFRPRKGQHMNNLDTPHSRHKPEKLFMFVGFFCPPILDGQNRQSAGFARIQRTLSTLADQYANERQSRDSNRSMATLLHVVAPRVWPRGRKTHLPPWLALFCPTLRAKSQKLACGNFNGFPPYSRGRSQSIAVTFNHLITFSHFNHFQSFSISLSHFQSLPITLTHSKHRNLLTTGRWGKTTLNLCALTLPPQVKLRSLTAAPVEFAQIPLACPRDYHCTQKDYRINSKTISVR